MGRKINFGVTTTFKLVEEKHSFVFVLGLLIESCIQKNKMTGIVTNGYIGPRESTKAILKIKKGWP